MGKKTSWIFCRKLKFFKPGEKRNKGGGNQILKKQLQGKILVYFFSELII